MATGAPAATELGVWDGSRRGSKSAADDEAALRTADASEARVRKAWDAYDVDASDSIDLGEVMSLMDDLGLLKTLTSDPVDFAVVVVVEVGAARAAVEGVAAEGLARVGLVAQRAGEAAPRRAVAGGGGCGGGR